MMTLFSNVVFLTGGHHFLQKIYLAYYQSLSSILYKDLLLDQLQFLKNESSASNPEVLFPKNDIVI